MFKFPRPIRFTVLAVLMCVVVLAGAVQADIKKNKTTCEGSIQSSGFIKTYHFCKLEVFRYSIKVTALDINSQVIDEFIITRQ